MERIVFAGTPEFALASLTALVDAGRKPVAVYTQPDRPAGRGRKLTASPVKNYALEQGIPVLQPESLRDDDAVAELAELKPDLMVVAAYGLILPQNILDIPTHGCLNVHASLLPRWRGAAPIQAAILAGDEETGVCLMQMEAGLDTGPVFSEAAVAIDDEVSAGELHDLLASLGGKLLVRDIDAIIAGGLEPQPQDEVLANYAAKISRQDAELEWSRPASELARAVRAYNPVPGAWFERGDTRIKVWRASVDTSVAAQPGEIVQFDRERIVIACGDGGLVLEELQLAGKRRAPAHEFVGQIDLR